MPGLTDGDRRTLGAVAVHRAITTCDRCDLRAEATAPVPWSGPLSPDIGVLGEAPGRTENAEGRPFIGPAGRLLRGRLRDLGFDPNKITFLNAANCWPSSTKTPEQEHLDACRSHLAGQLLAIQPTYLLVAGTTALAALVGDHITMKQVRGRPLWLERLEPFAPFTPPVTCWPLYHPSAALRSASYLNKVVEDLESFAKFVRGKEAFPGTCITCGEVVDYWDDYGLPWCSTHAGKQTSLL